MAPPANRSRGGPDAQQAHAKAEVKNPAMRPPQHQAQRSAQPTQQQQRPAQQPQQQQQRQQQRPGQQRAAQPKAEAKNPGGISPRSRNMIRSVSEVLQPYNYSESQIHEIIKRCGNNEEKVNMEVLKIMQEAESWDHTATASERKDKKSEATERRLQREKEQAEEMEQLKEQRKKAEDDRQRRLREEAERRRKEAEEKRLTGGHGQGVKGVSRNAGGTSAWRKADSDEAAAAEKGDEDGDQGWGNDNADETAMLAEQVAETSEQTASAAHDWTASSEQTPGPPADVDNKSPPEKATASNEVADTWSQPPAGDVSQGWTNEKSWPSDGGYWGSSTVQDAATHAAADSTPAAAPAAYVDNSNGPSEGAVVMPPAYAAFFASYQEPKLMFGSLHVNGNSGHR